MATIDKLRSYAEVHRWRWADGDYGWKGLIGVSVANEPVASCVAASINMLSREDDYVVLAGHSNGGAICALAAQECPAVKQLLLINPALEDDWEFPDHLHAVHVFGTPGDFWTKAAQLLPGSEWGDLSNGYEGNQSFVTYHNMLEDRDFPIDDHSEVFSHENAAYWLPRMMDEVESRVAYAA